LVANPQVYQLKNLHTCFVPNSKAFLTLLFTLTVLTADPDG
jgi:hypothetical protein